MQYSVNTSKTFQLKSIFKYTIATLFIVFTVALFSLSWNSQKSCNPLIGKSPCVPEHHSMMERSWNATKQTASKFKDGASHLINDSSKLLPNHSMMEQSWNATKNTASNFKDGASHLIHDSFKFLPNPFVHQ